MEVSRYDLFLDLDFQGLKFKGTVGVTLRTERDVDLNSVGLDIQRVSSAGTNLPFSMKDGTLTVNTGQYTGLLQIEFAGRVWDTLAGIYRAPYDHTHIISTHFEAAQARRMFPCVDQPDAKAEFKLSVKIDRELEAISNMPVENQKNDGDKKIVTFQTTPRMSTYLLYLGVGRFETITSEAGETQVIVATTPGKVELGRFAEAEARQALGFFNSYYKIPYALPKVHLIAVPEFPAGAMENWGAITFREILLLIGENTSSRIKMRAAMAIAHELAHQWFGDLVTMKWWDDIWLNESFATYMAYKAVDHAHPEWRIWENFFNGEPKVESQAGAMERDSLRNTHPIHVQVTSPEEIEQIFDEISYGKGAHVLRMIDAYVGEESFRDGVRRYLTSHAYSNARGDDLWTAIEETSGKPVRKIMSAWIRQPGFPVITPRFEGRTLKLTQNRMSISGKLETASWPVPLIVEVNGERQTILMEDSELRIKVDTLKTLRINPDRTGFYAANIKHVSDEVWAGRPSPIDRWGLIFDAFQFLLSGTIKFSDYESILARFEEEDHVLPAREVSNELNLLYTLCPSEIAPISKPIHRTFVERFIHGSDEVSSILHGALAERLAKIDPEYAKSLASSFADYGRVSPEMRAAAATAYASSTGDIDTLIEAYRKSNSDEDKIKILTSMTVFGEENLVEKALNFAIGGEVKRQDVMSAVRGAASNPAVRNMTWTWMKREMGRLQELYQGTAFLSLEFSTIIPLLCIGKVSEAQQYFAGRRIVDAEVGINVGLEKLHTYNRLASEITGHDSSEA